MTVVHQAAHYDKRSCVVGQKQLSYRNGQEVKEHGLEIQCLKFKFQIFYFRVYNILHTPLLLQLEREDKWFCGRVNTFKYKM